MKNTKKTAAVVITAVAITVSASALASATGSKSKSDSKSSGSKTERVFDPNGMGPRVGKGPKDGFRPDNKEAVITATLGIDATTLRNRLMAGESLATIAGAKKDALIAALVADESKQIDAAVTAGKLTAAQAATLKANLTAHVTEEVNEIGFRGGRGGDKDGMDGHRDGKGRHGHDRDGMRGQGPKPTTTSTSAN